jgi:anti-repressor protein
MDRIYTFKLLRYDLDVYGTLEKPLFLAVDIAALIDYSIGNTAHMLGILDPEDKVLMNTRNSNTSIRRGNPEKWFITEDGFYEVLMQSRKPIARKFKRAVKDILHDLRMQRQDNLIDWLDYPDDLSDEWEDLNRQREADGLNEIEWNDFLRSKGWTDDMLSDN